MKYCPNCGKDLKKETVFCPNCGSRINNIKDNINPDNNDFNNVNNTTYNNGQVKQPKSKVAAGVLGILLGCFGVHNFYLGYTGKAIAQLLITLLSCGILSFVSAIWGLIEGIMILTGSINVDAEGNMLGE